MQQKYRMETHVAQTSYVSLKLSEIQARFEELMAEEEQSGLSLVEQDPHGQTIAETCNPYNRDD